MAGFDPDTPEEMQEFIRVSTLFLGWRTSTESESQKWSISDDPRQALEDEHPLPNVVPQALEIRRFLRFFRDQIPNLGKLCEIMENGFQKKP